MRARDSFLFWILREGHPKRIIRVKSWFPVWGRHGIEWPSVLVDTQSGSRMTMAPIWDRCLLRGLFPVICR